MFLMAAVEAMTLHRWILLIPIALVFLFSLRLYRKDYNARPLLRVLAEHIRQAHG